MKGDEILGLPVKFGNVTVADGCSIGCTVTRADLTLDEADAVFCGSRVAVRLGCDPGGKGDAQGQQSLVDTGMTMECLADVKSMRFTLEKWSFSLVFVDGSYVDANVIRFARKLGVMNAKRVDSAGADERDLFENAEAERE